MVLIWKEEALSPTRKGFFLFPFYSPKKNKINIFTQKNFNSENIIKNNFPNLNSLKNKNDFIFINLNNKINIKKIKYNFQIIFILNNKINEIKKLINKIEKLKKYYNLNKINILIILNNIEEIYIDKNILKETIQQENNFIKLKIINVKNKYYK